MKHLTVTFSNGAQYGYTGKTKKECKEKYLKNFGNFKGVKIEWSVTQ